VVESHGGTLRVDDTREAGTAITVSLPDTAVQGSAPVLVTEASVKQVALRVLIVDDERELLDAMCESLGALGHSIVGVTSAASALEQLDCASFDLILSDLRMPGMDGAEFYESACEMRPALRDRFVFMTGDSMTSRAMRFLDRVGSPHIDKPFDMESVRAMVAAFEPIEQQARSQAEVLSPRVST
jgi:CheY-like chemotaxis protein